MLNLEKTILTTMKLWRIKTWGLLFAFMPLIVPAASLQEMESFCQAKSPADEASCHLQPCPCSPGEVRLKRFQTGPTGGPHCACRSALAERQQTRGKAVAICDKYRRNRQQTCFVSSGDCPRGFDAIASFSSPTGNRFSACLDSRHQQAALNSTRPYLTSNPDLFTQYNTLIRRLESEQTGTAQSLPPQTLQTLGNSFPGHALGQLSLIRTQALEQGCFTDCNRIFCADDGRVESWTNGEKPLISRDLLHQLVHAVHCQREGGREGFVKHWFQHLPEDVHARLQTNQTINAQQLHFAMYMETHANNRADALCRLIPGCQAMPAR